MKFFLFNQFSRGGRPESFHVLFCEYLWLLYVVTVSQVVSVYLICCLDIDAPTNLVTTEVTEDTATVSWDPVEAEIEGYILTYSSAEGSSFEIPVGRDSTSYRLIGLRPGVLYTVYIWAFKGDKVSSKSSTEAETGKLQKGYVFINDFLCMYVQYLKTSQQTLIYG